MANKNRIFKARFNSSLHTEIDPVEFNYAQIEEGFQKHRESIAKLHSRLDTIELTFDRLANSLSNSWLNYAHCFYQYYFYSLKVKYNRKEQFLYLIANSKIAFTSQGTSPYDFTLAVYEYIFDHIRNFHTLPEKDKSVFLLSRLGINVDFCQKQRSWIAAPDRWILSESLDFRQINNILLYFIYTGHGEDLPVYLKHMLFAVLGIEAIFPPFSVQHDYRTITGNDNCLAWWSIRMDLFAKLCLHLKFAERAVLNRKYVKHNHLNVDMSEIKTEHWTGRKKTDVWYPVVSRIKILLTYNEYHEYAWRNQRNHYLRADVYNEKDELIASHQFTLLNNMYDWIHC